MIFYKNFSGKQLRDRRDEVEVIRQGNGQADAEGNEFELIELAHSKVLKSPEKRHGWQDTDVVHDEQGQLRISHRLAGQGTLRFEPNDFGNAMAYIAKTEHNMDMLAKAYRNKNFNILNKNVESEVKERFAKIWATMSDADKKKVYEQEERSKKSMFDMPKYVPPTAEESKTDRSGDRLVEEIASLKKQLEEARAGGQVKKVTETVTEAVAPVQVVEAPKPDPWIVSAKDNSVYDFNSMTLFDARKIAKKYNVPYGPKTDKATLVPNLLEAIEKEKVGVPVA